VLVVEEAKRLGAQHVVFDRHVPSFFLHNQLDLDSRRGWILCLMLGTTEKGFVADRQTCRI
jgi:hypothetical protein